MSQRRLRDELRDAFDTLSEPAHPALSARIRAELRSQPATGHRAPRLAAALAVLAAVLIVASLFYVSRHPITSPTVPGARPTPAATAPPTTQPSVPGPSAGAQATPVPGAGGPSTSPPASLPPFSCSAQSGQGPTPPPNIGLTAVRASAQSGYDRFVIQFNGQVPQYTVQPVATATFVQDASGKQVTLSGSAGLLVTLQGAQSAGSYTGPTDQKPAGTAVLKEARQVGDFEGVVHWGLGLSHASCFRVFTLTSPSRLVVDVQS